MKNKMSSFRKDKLPILLCGSAIAAGLISFFITLSVYEVPDSKINDNNIIISKNDVQPKSDNNYESQKISEKNNLKEEINTASSIVIEKEVIEQEAILEEDYEVVPTVAEVNVSEEITDGEEKIHESLFEYPLSGEVGLNYSMEKLIYSKTLDEWITHNGIDIIGKEADVVKSIADGTVESIKMDPRYGNTIIINHNNGYKSIYSNLSTTDLVYVGKKVCKGDIISGVGTSFGFESLEEPHIHFTILKDNEVIDPTSIYE